MTIAYCLILTYFYVMHAYCTFVIVFIFYYHF